MIKCKNCNIEFEARYKRHNREGYIINKNVKCCSKECAMNLRYGYTKDNIEKAITELVLKEKRYILQSEILKSLSLSSKTLNKYKVSIKTIQFELGFSKPKSIFENSVYNILCEDYSDVIREYSHNDLLSPKEYNIFIDFHIPSLNLFIEADGTQHDQKDHMWYSDYYNQCDLIKEHFVKKNWRSSIKNSLQTSFKKRFYKKAYSGSSNY